MKVFIKTHSQNTSHGAASERRSDWPSGTSATTRTAQGKRHRRESTAIFSERKKKTKTKTKLSDSLHKNIGCVVIEDKSRCASRLASRKIIEATINVTVQASKPSRWPRKWLKTTELCEWPGRAWWLTQWTDRKMAKKHINCCWLRRRTKLALQWHSVRFQSDCRTWRCWCIRLDHRKLRRAMHAAPTTIGLNSHRLIDFNAHAQCTHYISNWKAKVQKQDNWVEPAWQPHNAKTKDTLR